MNYRGLIRGFSCLLFLAGFVRAEPISGIGEQAVRGREFRAIDEKDKKKVRVTGQVQKAGKIELTRGMTLKKAIEKAGGFSPLANRKKVKITRKGKTMTHNLQSGDGPVLQAGDSIYVPERLF